MLIASGYWTFPEEYFATGIDNPELVTYECPFEFCDREEPVSVGTESVSYCRSNSHRDSLSVLCGKCLVSISELTYVVPLISISLIAIV